MEKTIEQMVDEATGYLEANGYAEETKREYRRAWGKFEEWCQGHATTCPDEASVAAYVEEMGWKDAPGRSFGGKNRRCVQVLVEYGRTGVWRKKCCRLSSGPPECLERAYDDYRDYLERAGLQERTVYGKLHAAKNMMRYLCDQRGIADMRLLGVEDAVGYAASLSAHAPSTRAMELYELRGYLAFAVGEYGLDPELLHLFPTIPSAADAVLPSVFTSEEVKALVEAARDADGPNKRRNLALVMLAVTTGMRVSDMKGLTMEDVDWRKQRVSFVQQKGGKRNVVPLLPECELALADYIRNERPPVDDPHVFVVPKAPYGPYVEHNTFHHVISRLLADAGVDPGGRHFGMHALRHSFAVGMLTQKVPYEVISGVLGHEFANTTKRYLRVDAEALRPLCLEVPHV